MKRTDFPWQSAPKADLAAKHLGMLSEIEVAILDKINAAEKRGENIVCAEIVSGKDYSAEILEVVEVIDNAKRELRLLKIEAMIAGNVYSRAIQIEGGTTSNGRDARIVNAEEKGWLLNGPNPSSAV